MKISSFLALATTCLILAGCSSTPAKVNTGTITAKTFSFVNTAGKPVPEFVEKREAIHGMIQESVTRNLSAKGVSRVASGGDVTVAYLIIVGNNATTTAINDYFGYGGDTAALLDKAHSAYTDSGNPNYFEAGTLLIDIVDTKTFKLLKRNYVTRPLLRDVTAEVRAARMQEVVDEILKDLRVAK